MNTRSYKMKFDGVFNGKKAKFAARTSKIMRDVWNDDDDVWDHVTRWDTMAIADTIDDLFDAVHNDPALVDLVKRALLWFEDDNGNVVINRRKVRLRYKKMFGDF